MSTSKPSVPAFAAVQQGCESGTIAAELRRYVAAVAAEAPSVHNTQPWYFRADGPHFDLFADRTRQLAHLDPGGRLLTISCGAALDHAQLAIRGLGHAVHVQLFPAGSASDHLARLTIEEPDPGAPTPGEWALLQAVTDRSTYRGNFRDRLTGPLLAELHSAVAGAGCHLHRIERPGQRSEVGQLIREGEAAVAGDPEFFRELRRWRAREIGTDDGIPPSALGIGRAAAAQAAFPPRDFALDDRSSEPPADGPADLPVEPDVLAIWTAADGPTDWLQAGSALSRLLLTATCAGAAAGLLDQPLEVALIRSRLQRAIGVPGPVQALLRVGFPIGRAGATPRRGIDEILT